MAKMDLTEVEGFDELNRKLKTLEDRVKRTEVLKIFRRLAKPVIQAYSSELPVGRTGALSGSVKAVTVPARKSDGNPSIAVRPAKKGKLDPYYKFMVVPEGTSIGSRKRGSREGKNTVVEDARDRAVAAAGVQAKAEAVDKTADYIQKQINRLSR